MEPHSQPLTSQATSLVPLGPQHAERMLRWMLDPAVAGGIGLRQEPSMARTLDWIGQTLQSPDVAAFAILWEADHVGNIVLDRRDFYLQTARLSIYVGEASVRGHGVGRAAVSLICRYGFEQWALHKIWLSVHVENVSAIATYLKSGFVPEGLLRDEFLLAGRRVAAMYMGLLRQEWLLRNSDGSQAAR